MNERLFFLCAHVGERKSASAKIPVFSIFLENEWGAAVEIISFRLI